MHPNLITKMVTELGRIVDNGELLTDFNIDNDLKGFTIEKTVRYK